MSIGILALAGLVVVVLIVAAAFSGRGGGAAILAVLALVVLGAAGYLLLGMPAPPPPGATPLPPAPAVTVSSPAVPTLPTPVVVEGAGASGRVLLGAAGEVPAAGARLELFDASVPEAIHGRPVATWTAGDDGRFRVEAKGAPAEWMLRASLDGHAPALGVPEEGEDLELRLLPGRPVAGTVKEKETGAPVAGARIAIGAATTTAAADGSFLVPAAEGTIGVASATGFVPNNFGLPETPVEGLVVELQRASGVTGIVVDAAGAPVAGAKVKVELLRSIAMLPQPFVDHTESTTSGEDGTFAFASLEGGRKFRVSARTEDALSDPVEGEVPSAAGAHAKIELRLFPAGAILVTVTDEAGAPVAGAAIDVAPETGEDEGEDGVGGAAGAGFRMSMRMNAGLKDDAFTTDAEGRVRVSPVKPGPVRVEATREDHLPAKASAVAQAKAETPVALTLAAGLAVTGRCVDDLGAPVAGATVNVFRFSLGGAIHQTRTSAADGTFRVGGLEGRDFTLNATKDGHAPANLQNLVPGTPINVVLSRGGAIAGRVRDEEGRPVVSFRVFARRAGAAEPGSDPAMFDASAWGGTEVNDAGGAFRVDGLAPGAYALEVRAADLAPGRASGLTVTAAATTTADVVCPRGHALSGVVVRASDGGPVAGASVKVLAAGLFGEMDMEFDMGEEAEAASGAIATMTGGVASAVTGPDGRFELKGLEGPTVDLSVKARGLAPESAKGIAVPSAEDVRITLPDGGALEGTIYGTDGKPKGGAMVMLQKMPTFMRMITADGSGRYRVEGLPAGTYLFMVMGNPMDGAGMDMKSENVHVEAGRTTTKDWRPGEGTKVVGRVTRGGKAVAGAMVILMPASSAGAGPQPGGGFAMATSREDGNYEISGVGAGRYSLMVQAGVGGAGAPTRAGDPVDVAAGAREVRRDVEIPNAVLRGVVVDDSGAPVSAARVSAMVAGSDPSRAADLGEAMQAFSGSTMTDSAGAFEIDGVAPGTYTVRVSAAGHGSALVDGVAPSGAQVKIVLEKGVEVTVRVLDPDGKPIAGAGVHLVDSEGRDRNALDAFESLRTGADGTVAVRCPTGTFHFESSKSGFAGGRATATVPGTREVTVSLRRAAVVKVFVEDANGPVTGATVTLLDGDGRPHARRVSMETLAELMGGNATGPDGTATFKDLPAGSYGARAQVGERSAVAAVVTVAGGETKSITVKLE